MLGEVGELTSPCGQLICTAAVIDDVLSLLLLAEVEVLGEEDPKVSQEYSNSTLTAQYRSWLRSEQDDIFGHSHGACIIVEQLIVAMVWYPVDRTVITC